MSRSVRFLKPPNPQIATTSSARISRMLLYSTGAGIVLRFGWAVVLGLSDAAQLGSIVPAPSAVLCSDVVGAGCTGTV